MGSLENIFAESMEDFFQNDLKEPLEEFLNFCQNHGKNISGISIRILGKVFGGCPDGNLGE